MRSHHAPVEIPSDFTPTDLEVTPDSLIRHFERVPVSTTPLRNFHHEPRVSPEVKERAKPSAVLMPFVDREAGLTLLFTRRHESISAPGQLCFPGGRVDAVDRDRVATALRETEEETGIAQDAVHVLGQLGSYVSHSAHDIVPIIGLLTSPPSMSPNPGEVEEILELPAAVAFRASAYRLVRHRRGSAEAHFVLAHEEMRITGLTVCLLMNLYAELAVSHASARRAG